MLDDPVKATADDAMVAKLATTQAGYYLDPFLHAFCRSADDDSITPSGFSRTGIGKPRISRRRTVQPIIKRGTHARVCVMDRAISGFLKMSRESSAGAACQVVVLGAGKDTSYFRYRNENLMGMEEKNDDTRVRKINSMQQIYRRGPQRQHVHKTSEQTVHWHEVDHVSVVKEKASLIRRSSLLKSFCPLLTKTKDGYKCESVSNSLLVSSEENDSSPLSSSTYHLVGHDLRDSPTTLLEKLNLNSNLPTLFIMECVLMYIPIAQSRHLLQALSVSTNDVFIACYEPILGSNSSKKGDPFGRVMERNLVKMGVASPDSCLLQTRTLEHQLQKLIECTGFVRSVGCDMWSAYETIVTESQRKRANQSEFMDEYEEWILIMQHYCFFVAQGGRSPRQEDSLSNMTTILVPNTDDNKSCSLLGWVSGKCLELQK